MQKFFRTLLLITLTISSTVFFQPVLGQSDIRKQRVQFQRGATSKVIEGSITGYEIVDYILGAMEGQYMNVSMATNNTSNYFNILMPGENEEAMFNGSGSINGNQYEGTLPQSGDYKIRVYMMRSAARRNEVANYRLEMIITGSPNKQSNSNNGDAFVEGTNYNATGEIPCKMVASQPTSSCPFGVIRQGNGSGTVTITKPDGRTRVIFFQKGEATGYDVNQADSGKFSSQKQGDLSIIKIGEERYEIPEVVIFGD